MKKQRFYIIEFGGEEQIHEMEALEQNNIQEAIEEKQCPAMQRT